jgi:ArsR family transcriptional regulator, arsenate/arsenite/antimonite-responsive transcriptional repressor / arsenate reductase (thioredoxin)
MDVQTRARAHAALGDPHRLRIVDELLQSDRTFLELAELIDLPANAAAHHVQVLEDAGLLERHPSEGDRRRRYLTLRHAGLAVLGLAPVRPPRAVVFVCTHNSARSQFASALWSQRTGLVADSAGSSPAAQVHPLAVAAAAAFDVDLSGRTPKAYVGVDLAPDLVVSVCDRAREAGVPFSAPAIHWSIPDPVLAGSPEAFRSAFAAIAARVGHLAGDGHAA